MLAAAVLLAGVVSRADDAECPQGWVETEYAKTLGGRRDTAWCNANCKKDDGTVHLACDATHPYDVVVWEEGDSTNVEDCGGSKPGKCPAGKKCWRCHTNNGDGRFCPKSAGSVHQYYCHERCKGEAPGRQNNGGDCPPKCQCPRSTAEPTAFPTGWPTKFPTEKPTAYPTAKPTEFPTPPPTEKPTAASTCEKKDLYCPTDGCWKSTPCRYADKCVQDISCSCPTTDAQGNQEYEKPLCSGTTPTSFPTAKPTEYPTSSPTRWLDQYITMGGQGAAGFELGLVGVLPGKDCGGEASPPHDHARAAKILGHLSHSSSPFVLEAASFKGDVDFHFIKEFARNGVVAEIRALSGATPTVVPAHALSFTMKCEVAEQCDAFVFVYHDPPHSGSTNGDFPATLLEDDAWEAGSCAPVFRCESVQPLAEAERCKFHMVAFKKTLAQGQTVDFAVGSHPLMFALFMVVPKVPCTHNNFQTEAACSATHSCDDPKVTSTCVYADGACTDKSWCSHNKPSTPSTPSTCEKKDLYCPTDGCWKSTPCRYADKCVQDVSCSCPTKDAQGNQEYETPLCSGTTTTTTTTDNSNSNNDMAQCPKPNVDFVASSPQPPL